MSTLYVIDIIYNSKQVFENKDVKDTNISFFSSSQFLLFLCLYMNN